jgi:Mn-containing catalase
MLSSLVAAPLRRPVIGPPDGSGSGAGDDLIPARRGHIACFAPPPRCCTNPSQEKRDDKKLQYEVRVDTPNPQFAKLLQQAIGGVEGEIRVALQYLFQAWGARGPAKYRDMLLETGAEEIGHIEMLATAVALNLEGAPSASVKDEAAKDPAVAAILGGMNPRHMLSSGLAAMPVDASGVPFDASHVYASGNLAADMYANVTAEATGRTLACGCTD